MGFPDKPKELELFSLEERLVSLRIPLMQIRELPSGGQFSVKGNVVNVPVDIQPTIQSLPRNIDETGTIAVKVKRRLEYKSCDYSENVRPLEVICALHYLVRNSELYKSAGIHKSNNKITELRAILQIRVITKLPNSEQSYKGKVKTHNYINRQNQSTTGKL